jgi:predicted nuclease of predicted toxin-antitoxin system
MIIWIDAQLSPSLASWIQSQFHAQAKALREIGLRDASDREIFWKAKEASAIIITKDSDFLRLLDEFGAPPKIIWITCGNTSNNRLKEILITALPKALTLFDSGEKLVEISDAR